MTKVQYAKLNGELNTAKEYIELAHNVLCKQVWNNRNELMADHKSNKETNRVTNLYKELINLNETLIKQYQLNKIMALDNEVIKILFKSKDFIKFLHDRNESTTVNSIRQSARIHNINFPDKNLEV